MKNLVLVVLSLLFIYSGSTFANASSYMDKNNGVTGGIDFTYSQPEMFFTDQYTLKLSVIWEILNCFAWEDGVPVDQCQNLEFYVINDTVGGEQPYISQLEGTSCLDGCEAIVKLPLTSLLTPDEYTKYLLGVVIFKHVRLHLAFGGEEDQYGRVVGRKIACTYYDLKFVLNGTGFQTVSVVRLERINSTPIVE